MKKKTNFVVQNQQRDNSYQQHKNNNNNFSRNNYPKNNFSRNRNLLKTIIRMAIFSETRTKITIIIL